MAAFIARQPNGRYCRFSSVVDCPTHWNLTKEEYLDNATGTVKNRADGEDTLQNYIRPFSEVIESFEPNNMTDEEFRSVLVDMFEEVEG